MEEYTAGGERNRNAPQKRTSSEAGRGRDELLLKVAEDGSVLCSALHCAKSAQAEVRGVISVDEK